MKRDYDEAITTHYEQVASQEGAAPTSTMADMVTRRMETDAILSFVDILRSSAKAPLAIADVGCGNGYTVGTIAGRFPDVRVTGIEKNDGLRKLACERVRDANCANASIMEGDIRDAGFAGEQCFDAVVCQRVLINLLNPADQALALENIIASVKSGGALLFIESFQAGLDRLNLARTEFDLPAIPPAHHNLYLSDTFFDVASLQRFQSEGWNLPPNFLSTHFYVTRVLHPLALGDREFKRNSEFVKFLSAALAPAVGGYSQIELHAFTKVA